MAEQPELSYEVRGLADMVYLAATFDRAFPEAFLHHVPIRVIVLATDSVAGSRKLEDVLLDRVRNYRWFSDNLLGLRSLAHLSEMLACADELLGNIADHVNAVIAVGRPLRFSERQELFVPLEEIGHVVRHAAEACVPMVRTRSTTVAHQILFLATRARDPFHYHEFLPQRILNRVVRHRAAIAEIMQLAPPIV